MDFKKSLSKLDVLDIGLIKGAVLFFTLSVVAFSPEFADWVQSTDYPLFLALSVIFAARPVYRAYIKK